MVGHFAIILVVIYLASSSLATKEKVPSKRVKTSRGNNVISRYRDACDEFDYQFYEFRSNEYRRGFVEMHFRLCDLVNKDFFFGPALRANGVVCPMPAGEHHVVNATVPELPLLRTFPFRKGRVYFKAERGGDLVVTAHADVEIKQISRVF